MMPIPALECFKAYEIGNLDEESRIFPRSHHRGKKLQPEEGIIESQGNASLTEAVKFLKHPISPRERSFITKCLKEGSQNS